MDATIRPATAADAEEIAALFIASRKDAMPYLPDLHTQAETSAWIAGHVLNDFKVAVAEVGGEIAGFVALAADELEHLYVHPDRQGNGIGSLLLDEAKRMRPRGLELWVFQRNTRARGFYESRGFRLVEFTDGARNEEREPDARYAWP